MGKFLANAKNMTDTSWATFVGKLQWKASLNGNNCRVVKVSRYFPSSQLCSHCGFQKRDLKVSERSWKCPECGTEHNRDRNAAVNLKQEALKILVAIQELKSVENHLESIERLARPDLLKQKTKSREAFQ